MLIICEHTISLLRYLHATAILSRRDSAGLSNTEFMSLHKNPKHTDKYLIISKKIQLFNNILRYGCLY